MRRSLIIFLAIVWGVFVFLPGSVLLRAALWRTALAALPLIIAAIVVVDEGKRWRKYLQWLYAVVLAMFGVFIWGGLGSIPYLFAAMLLLLPEIKGYFSQGGRKAQLTRNGLILAGFGIFFWWVWFHNPLPGDEKLIEHFNAHRAEFEQLAQRYRNHRDRKTFYHPSTPEIVALMGKAGVNYIAEAGGGFDRWFPEPYSEHTLQVRKWLGIRSSGNYPTEYEIMATYRREFPTLFEEVTPPIDVLDIARVTLPILFFLGSEPNQPLWGKRTIRYLDSFLNKGFCYYPQPPRVENGHIIDADYSLMDKAYTRPGLRVFNSLDAYPPRWERGEYILKRIDDHWFLFMCRVTP